MRDISSVLAVLSYVVYLLLHCVPLLEPPDPAGAKIKKIFIAN
jgi:hypothetical protein